MQLETLLAALPLVPPLAGPGPEITAVTADARAVAPGSLFVAIRGDAHDGHRLIGQALAAGAVAVVGQEPSPPEAAGVPYFAVPDSRQALGLLAAAWHGYPSRQLVLVGVTGTDGKTTTASLIHAILLAAGHRAGLISTVSAVIGDESLDTGFHVTTPDAPAVQGYLARMVAAGLTHAVLEVTSHGLAQQRVAGCEFDLAVVTNITHEHLDYHKSYEQYRAAKGLLFAGLGAAGPKPGGPAARAAVLNADDDSLDYLRSVVPAGTAIYRYSARSRDAELWARDVDPTPAGVGFRAVTPDWMLPLHTGLVGSHNVSNCLAAVAATVLALGVPPGAAQAGVAALPGVPGRMERVDLGQPFTAMVDFAHTPNALRRALEAARELARPDGRVIAVFGSAGLRDIEKRRLMAATAAELADLAVLTAEDPRTEALHDILEMMAGGARSRGGVEGATFFRVPDRGEALRLAVGLARSGDVVLACGKGHEQSMCFGTVEYAWDDRVALRAALAELLGQGGPPMPRLPTSGAQ